MVSPTGHLQVNVNKAINIQERSDCAADDCSYTSFDMIQRYDGADLYCTAYDCVGIYTIHGTAA